MFALASIAAAPLVNGTEPDGNTSIAKCWTVVSSQVMVLFYGAL